MTRQEIFNTVWNGLKSQGFECSAHNGTCLYRGPNGRKCAAGWLIPDEEFDDALNAKKAEMVPFFMKNFYDQMEFICKLQLIHDSYTSPDLMKTAFINYATIHGLEIPQ